MIKKHVNGENKGSILLYALSTCGWCKKTKNLLNELQVEYDYIDVDELAGEEKEQVREEIRRHNPQCSFPTVLIGDTCIVGFKENEIREAITR
jgi:glutaredoxin